MKNTRTIEVWVNTRKIEPSDSPISAAKIQNIICAVAGRMRSMPKLSTNTIASGASMITHLSGLTKT